jgi:putative holliday junction resolvase
MASALIALDVGEKRIGVAVARGGVRIAVPLVTIEVDGQEIERIKQIASEEATTSIIVGLPRNQSGETTAQSEYVRQFAVQLAPLTVIYQDESLTSVHAEALLKAQGKSYTKGDIDKLAAARILQDYLEQLS